MGAPPVTNKAAIITAKATKVTQNDIMFSTGKRHVARADLDGQEVIAEAGERRRGQHEEHHDGAVHGHHGEVELRRHRAAGEARREDLLEHGPLLRGPSQAQAHQHRERHADEHREQRSRKILDSDHLVIHAEDVLPDEPPGLLRRTLRVSAIDTSSATDRPSV